jgi:Hypoxia induced protein conserved region
MKYILIPVVIVLLVMVVISLVRGIMAFMHSTKLDLESDGSTGATEMQLKQNKMMFARIKYQALAVVVVAILLAVSQ